ncbi:MAG TPA: ZIP family metal transporter [Balneolaceae bacterium]|nr:ZIP family metal transporter [Balneolaceae bacterium]
MSELILILLISWLAGLMALTGGVIAKFEGSAETELKRELTHGIAAFGGGILIAAVAFTLAPKGIEYLSTGGLVISFVVGGSLFCFLDYIISNQVGSRANLMAMMMDFVPESIAMGALFVESRATGLLLAIFIALQNLPEGFNSFRESVEGESTAKSILFMLFLASFFGPIAALVGYLFLADSPVITASITSFASGGILYLIFQDIAPQSKMSRRWLPALGAVLGFTLGMVGTQLLG